MDNDDQEFLLRLLETFRIEAEEHFDVLSNGLLELEREPEGDGAQGLVETLFREAHSLKGAARAVELTDIESVCQAMESVFAVWKRNEIGPSTGLFDTLNEAVDALRESSEQGGGSASSAAALAGLIQRLHQLAEAKGGGVTEKAPPAAEAAPGGPKTAAPAPPRTQAVGPAPAAKPAVADKPAKRSTPQPAPVRTTPAAPKPRQQPSFESADKGDTIRVSLSKLTDLMLRMEEMVTVKLVLRQRTAELNELMTAFDIWRKRWQAVQTEIKRPEGDVWLSEPPPEDEHYLEIKRRRSDTLLEYVDWSSKFITELSLRIGRLSTQSEVDMRTLGPLVEELLEDVKTIVMLPFSSLSAGFPKMMRDLGRAEGKAVDLTVTGGDIEIDRHVLETMKDPIVHILRNCVGHGIEPPDVRAKRGKPVRGAVTIDVGRVEGNKIMISIADDGGGIDSHAVREVASKAGVRSGEQLSIMDDTQALSLVFESGVSTNPIVTDVSGRGIGLAVVQEKVEQLGGNATVRSAVGVGTTFEMVVPATVASSRGVIVRLADRLFVVPTVHVERVARIDPAEIATIENVETVNFDGDNVSFTFLNDSLELPRRSRGEDSDLLPLIVLTAGGDRIAFAVDWILGEQEVLVKGLGPQLESVRYVSGATVLESERIALILNPPELIRAAIHGAAPRTTTAASVVAEKEQGRRRILVAEDSITSRTLLKNILETAGYYVHTSVDGMEAFTALMEDEFDLVITDVEMPRMNGFDLCAKIRADKKYADLPVMLVTSLESREDREKGVDVGANAYITKGSFDQTTLLETARRLM
jgi:two-component system, chemotaxis family, sensor kinase CheA